jgi:rod shape-determining protein MreD
VHFLTNRKLIFVFVGLLWAELFLCRIFLVRTIKPDLFFVFIAFYAFHVERKNVVTLAFVLGLAKDLCTNTFFGLEALSYSVAAVLFELVAVRFDRSKKIVQLVSIFLISQAALIFYAVFSLAIGISQGFAVTVPWKAFHISAYTALFGLILFPILERWVKPSLSAKQYELFEG